MFYRGLRMHVTKTWGSHSGITEYSNILGWGAYRWVISSRLLNNRTSGSCTTKRITSGGT